MASAIGPELRMGLRATGFEAPGAELPGPLARDEPLPPAEVKLPAPPESGGAGGASPPRCNSRISRRTRFAFTVQSSRRSIAVSRRYPNVGHSSAVSRITLRIVVSSGAVAAA